MTLLSIAGFDPSSGAGITADLMVFAAHGFFGTSCVTALTVQSTTGVRGVEAVGGRIVQETLECLDEDLPPDGIKIGMLATVDNVNATADYLTRLRKSGRNIPVVLDPVLRSTSGEEMISADGLEAMMERLLPLVDWLTPNLSELGVLTEISISSAEEMEDGAAALQAEYPKLNVVVTGGHLADVADDLVVGGRERAWLRGEKIKSDCTHGTGCAFSSAMLCNLVSGRDGVGAAEQAKRYVAGAIRHAVPVGRGKGPTRLLWPFDRESKD